MNSSLYSKNVVNLLRNSVQVNPHKIYFKFLADGEETTEELSYQNLWDQSLRVSNELETFPIGTKAILLFESGADFTVAFWACVLSGIVAVPVYPPYDQRSLKRFLKIIEDSEAGILLTNEPMKAKLGIGSWLYKQIRKLSHLNVDVLRKSSLPSQIEPRGIYVEVDTILLLQYTSGSTGSPKGVMISHKNILHNFSMFCKVLDPSLSGKWKDDCLVSWLPVYHDMGLIGGVIFPALCEAQVVMMSPLMFLQKPIRWLKAISRHKATVSVAPNFGYSLCVKKIKDEDMQGVDLSSWSMALNGAEPIQSQVLTDFSNKFSQYGFHEKVFFPTYGLAESTIFVSGGNRFETFKTKDFLGRKLVGCGKADDGMEIKLISSESEREVSEAGEICIHGDSVTSGYWNRPEKNDSWVEIDGKRFLKTGDLGIIYEGELYITGRIKDLIIIRGRNLYPQDIEETIHEVSPVIRQGAVAAFSVESAAQGEELVILAELSHAISKEEQKEIQATIVGATTREFGVMAKVCLLSKGSLLKTSSGKMQRSKNKELFLLGKLS